jgi:hypothetical protein
MKTFNIAISQLQPTQRYTYMLRNPKLPKWNPTRELYGTGNGNLELQERLLDFINDGWILIELKLQPLNVSSMTMQSLKNVATCFDNLINEIDIAQQLINAEQREYKTINGNDSFDSEINAVNMSLSIRKQELIEMRSRYCHAAHIKLTN